jgi:hypothetical protein
MTPTPPRRSDSTHRHSKRRAPRQRIAIAALALACGLLGAMADAHDSPDAHWCSVDDTAVIELGRFDFTGAQMRVLAQAQANLPGSCGQVDHIDEWKCALQIAQNYCSTLSESQSLDQVAAPIIVGPPTAVADDHHDRYALSAGLYGACVICDLHPGMQDQTQD